MVNLIYCFDIDETLCKSKNLDYAMSTPYPDRIKAVNELYDKGFTIKLYPRAARQE